MLEKIRDQIHAATPEPADFNLGLNGERTVFNLDDVNRITFNEQDGADPLHFTPVELDVGLLHIIPGAVGTIAIGAGEQNGHWRFRFMAWRVSGRRA